MTGVDEGSHTFNWVRRRHSRPGKRSSQMPVELVSEFTIVRGFNTEACPDRLPYFLPSGSANLPEDREFSLIQVNDKCSTDLHLVSGTDHQFGRQGTIGQLAVEASQISERKRQERLGGGAAVEPLLEQEAHALRRPATQGAAEDPNAVAPDDRADEVPDWPSVGADHRNDRLRTLRGGKEGQPCGCVIDLGILVARDDRIPPHGS